MATLIPYSTTKGSSNQTGNAASRTRRGKAAWLLQAAAKFRAKAARHPGTNLSAMCREECREWVALAREQRA